MALKGTKALQSWCVKVTAGYPNVKIENMTKSWKDGLAFCAIIHHFRPELIDFNSLSKKNVRENCTLAFEVAERELGIPALLDPEDMVSMASPDKLSILTYLSQYYNFFKDKKPGGPPPLATITESNSIADPSGKDVEISDKGKEIRRRSFKRAKEKENKAAQGGPLPAKISLKSDKCEICGKRVYLVERQVVDGRLFHRNCFRCTKCRSTLRPDSYKLTKDPKKFECMCHSDNGDIWNLRMNVTSRAGARLAGVEEEGGTIWKSRSPKSPPKRPEQPPPQLPPQAKSNSASEPVAGNSTPAMPPTAGGNNPPVAGAVPLHPHLLKSAARARFNQSGSPVGSPQLQRHPYNGSVTSLATQRDAYNGSVTSLATQRDADMAASQEALNKTPADSPARPVPLPRVLTKPQANGEVPSGKEVKDSSADKSTTESRSEDIKARENREVSMFSTDDESKSSDVRSIQEGDSLGIESSDLDHVNDSFNNTFRDTDDTSAEESTAKDEVPTPKEIKEEDRDTFKDESPNSEQPMEVSVDQNEDVSVANKQNNKEEATLNTVNQTVTRDQEKTDLVIGTNDVTNKSVEEGSTGDSALWDTKAELSDSFQDENSEAKKAEEDASVIKTNDKTVGKESEEITPPDIVVEDERTGDKDSESKPDVNEVQVEGTSSKNSDDDYDESLNPFGDDDDDEEQVEETSKRQSTNPFESDEDDDGYDKSLNPFGDDDDEDEGNESHISDESVNPFTGSPVRETPLSLRLKSETRASSFSHPKRPERPPQPILSSGSYSVKTRSQILEELKRDRETLKKKRVAPAPPPGGSPGGVQAPPRARKSRKAPQPPVKAASDGELPKPSSKTNDEESCTSTPVPTPRTGPTANGTKTEPVPSPRIKKVQKVGHRLPIAGLPTKQIDLKNIELRKVKKPPADFRQVELRKVKKPKDMDERDRDGDDEMEDDAVWKKVKKDFDFLKEKKDVTKQVQERGKESKEVLGTGVTKREESLDVSTKDSSKGKEQRDEKASVSVGKEDGELSKLSKGVESKDHTENVSKNVSEEKEVKPKVRRYAKRDERRAARDEEMQEQFLQNENDHGVSAHSVGDGIEKDEAKPKDLSLNIVPLKPKKKEELGNDLAESKLSSGPKIGSVVQSSTEVNDPENKVSSGPKIGSVVQSSAETDDLEDIMKNVMEFLNLDFDFEKQAVENEKLEDLEDKVELEHSAGKMELKKEKTGSLSRSKESKPLLSDGEEEDEKEEDVVTEMKKRSVRRSRMLSDDEPQPVPAPRKKRFHRRHSRRSDATNSRTSAFEDQPERPKYAPPSKTHSQGKRKAPAPPAVKREVGKDHVEVSLIQQELIDIEKRQRELEERGVDLETKLRQDTDDDAAHDDVLLAEWFDVVNQKNQLVRREGELIAQAQQQELELQHAEIEYELRVILQKQEHERIDADAQREEQLLEMLMEVVQKRNQIVERLEEDRLREEAEDRDIEAMMGVGNSDKKKEKKHKKKHKLGLIK